MRNIVARWRGSGQPGKKTLLLSAHYDSVPRGPGAGDDASGVAAILESLRALKAGPPPERDVIILINEGEEVGLFGADGLLQEHPWAKDVGVVLNFDARGNSGPSYMFETSEGNGWLIEQLARALPHPMATSMTVDVYRLMPNDTDLTIYKQTRHAGPELRFRRRAEVLPLPRGYAREPRSADAPASGREPPGDGPAARSGSTSTMSGAMTSCTPRSCSSSWRSIPWTWVVPLMGCAVLAYIAVSALGGAWTARAARGDRRRLRGLPVCRGRGDSCAIDALWMVLGDILQQTWA